MFVGAALLCREIQVILISLKALYQLFINDRSKGGSSVVELYILIRLSVLIMCTPYL